MDTWLPDTEHAEIMRTFIFFSLAQKTTGIHNINLKGCIKWTNCEVNLICRVTDSS